MIWIIVAVSVLWVASMIVALSVVRAGALADRRRGELMYEKTIRETGIDPQALDLGWDKV